MQRSQFLTNSAQQIPGLINNLKDMEAGSDEYRQLIDETYVAVFKVFSYAIYLKYLLIYTLYTGI